MCINCVLLYNSDEHCKNCINKINKDISKHLINSFYGMKGEIKNEYKSNCKRTNFIK